MMKFPIGGAEAMNYKRPTKLYRIPSEGKCMGVCAGIADYSDVNVTAIRILFVIALFMSGIFPAIFVYFLVGILLDVKPADMYEDEKEEEFWRETRKSPDTTAADMRKRFRDIERRTNEMEAYMTSKRFRLERELRALED
jgi:phage shock protein C